MNTGENEMGLRKIIDLTRMISIIILLIHFYYFFYCAFEEWKLTYEITDRIIGNIRQTGLFKYFNKSKLFALLFLLISLIGAKGKKNETVAPVDNKYEYAEKDDQVKERKDLFEKIIKGDDLDIDKYNDFELIQDGRSGDSAMLKYKEKFSLKKLISKAGKNYIFEAGKLIGGQLKLEPNELKERKTDIWIPSAITIENVITVNVPDGYTVDGLQDLNMNIDNPSGTFISTAVANGNKLTISTRKIYKNTFDKKEAWPNYIAFLEPAYKLSQAKVVLKKK